MTTKTQPKTDILTELAKVEKRWADAAAEASRIGTEHHAKVTRFRDLHDERRRLIHRDPRLVDHLLAPLGPDNPVGKIDQEIAKLADLGDSEAKRKHADELERVAKQDANAFFVENFWPMMEAMRPDGEREAATVHQRIEALAEAVESYLRFVQRVQGYTAPIHGVTTHIVPGLDQASALKRTLGEWTLPVPVPSEE